MVFGLATATIRFSLKAKKTRALKQGKATVLKAIVSHGAPVTPNPLKNVGFPEHALIGMLVRKGHTIISRGETQVLPGDRVVAFSLEQAIPSVRRFTGIYMALFAVATLCMLAMGLDMVSAASSVAATLRNVGPGLGSVGPMANYAHLPGAGKLLLAFMMLVGRLEIFGVLVILTPAFWRK